MNGARLAGAVVAVTAVLALAASCTSIIGGIGDENKDVVTRICGCGDALGDLGKQLGHADECAAYLEKRFELSSEDERDTWLKAYFAQCTKCDKASTCFYMEPLCKPAKDGCRDNWECCSSPKGGICDAGVCE